MCVKTLRSIFHSLLDLVFCDRELRRRPFDAFPNPLLTVWQLGVGGLYRPLQPLSAAMRRSVNLVKTNGRRLLRLASPPVTLLSSACFMAAVDARKNPRRQRALNCSNPGRNNCSRYVSGCRFRQRVCRRLGQGDSVPDSMVSSASERYSDEESLL